MGVCWCVKVSFDSFEASELGKLKTKFVIISAIFKLTS